MITMTTKMLQNQRHSLPPDYLYSQSESHIMAAEMRTTTLPRASASTWRNTPWWYRSWRYQLTYLTCLLLRIASWRYFGYYQLCSSGPHWQGLYPESSIELTKNIQGEGDFVGCHSWPSQSWKWTTFSFLPCLWGCWWPTSASSSSPSLWPVQALQTKP